MKTAIVIAIAVSLAGSVYAESGAMERTAPVRVEDAALAVRFNGDYVKSYYRIFDARSAAEKARDARERRLAGSVAVFFHGHARRPDDADQFMTEFARRSKSGIIVATVCDTPYGGDPAWRGDTGKEVVLMETVRHALVRRGMSIHSYVPISGKMLTVDGEPAPGAADEKAIPVSLLAVGYSHGGILARRIASKYPSSVSGLAHISPAGYVKWGDNSLYSASCLAANFTWESLRIGAGYFTGKGGHINRAAWGVTRGFTGDCLRSYGSCLMGNPNPMRTARVLYNIRDCTDYLDDTRAPVPRIGSITVIFGENDTLFEYRSMGIRNPGNITRDEAERFWGKYYPSSAKNGARRTLRVLPGNHIGLQLHHGTYVETILGGAGELREDAPAISAR